MVNTKEHKYLVCFTECCHERKFDVKFQLEKIIPEANFEELCYSLLLISKLQQNEATFPTYKDFDVLNHLKNMCYSLADDIFDQTSTTDQKLILYLPKICNEYGTSLKLFTVDDVTKLLKFIFSYSSKR